MIKHFNYSFAPGMLRVAKEKRNDVKLAIAEVLGTKDEAFISRKKHLYRDIPAHIKEEITSILVAAGVEEGDIWIVQPA